MPWNYSHGTSSGESRRSCRTALMLAGGRQSRKTFQKNHREAAGEAVVRLGEALEPEVWKCQLSTCETETAENPPKIQLVRTRLECSMQPVCHWIETRSEFWAEPLCAAFPNTPLHPAWMKLLLPGAQPARGKEGRLNSCMKRQRNFSAGRFQMGSAWEGGARCSQESLCHSVLSSCSWPSLGTEQRLAPGLGAVAQPGIDPSSPGRRLCFCEGWGNA